MYPTRCATLFPFRPRSCSLCFSTCDVAHIFTPYSNFFSSSSQVGLLAAQYTCIFLAASTLYSGSAGCVPSHYSGAWAAWERGLCLTPEQVWCRAHGSTKHINCVSADCRAEEIRLSLFRSRKNKMEPSKEPIYPGCNAEQVAELYTHMQYMNGEPRTNQLWAACSACVPATDPRAAYLPTCTEEQAFCRGLHYRPPQSSNASSWDCAQLPRDYGATQLRKNTALGCLTDIPGGTNTPGR